MNRKYFLLVTFLLLQAITIYSQPNQLKALLVSIGGYNGDTNNQWITPLSISSGME